MTDAPETLEPRRELRFDVPSLVRGQPIAKLAEYDERHPLSAPLVASERRGHFTEEGSIVQGGIQHAACRAAPRATSHAVAIRGTFAPKASREREPDL